MSETASGTMPDGVWREVTDALLAGLTHDLNGRVSAITGLLRVLAPRAATVAQPESAPAGEVAVNGEVLRLLEAEGDRLEGVVSVLRRYPRGRSGDAEAIELRELLEGLADLHRRREDQQGVDLVVEVAAGAPAARAERTWLSRALLVLLARAGASAQGAGGARLRLRVNGRDDVVVVALEAPLGGESARAGTYLEAARAFALRAGGTIRLAGAVCELVLPAVAG